MPASESLGFRPFLDGHYDASLQLQMHVYRRIEAATAEGQRRRDALQTPEQVRDWQRYVRDTALAALGGLPEGDTPLAPEVRGVIAGNGFDVEKIIFQSLPHVYVTANLYLPRPRSGPTGAVVFVCGHGEAAKTYPTYQAVCQRLARNGLVVLAIDPIGQGERKSYLDEGGHEIVRWGVPEHTYAGIQCWWNGQSCARYFVHDARRAIDYLCTRPEVDPARIGITGNSGGGTQATWMMLVEPRLAAAAPGTFVMRLRDYMWTGQAQDAEQIIPGGAAAGLDHDDFLVAMAPRPVLVLAVEYDFFNLEATVGTVERARRIYRLLDAEQNLGLATARGTHEYHPGLARASTAFFVRHLGDRREIDDAEPRLFDPRDLQCTESGQVLLDRPDTRRVFDLNLAETSARRPDDGGSARRSESARAWLDGVVRRSRRPVEFYPRWLPGATIEGMGTMHGYWWSEADVLGAGVLVRPTDGTYHDLVVALFDAGTFEIDERQEWLQARIRTGQAVLVLDVRGRGTLLPRAVNAHPFEEHHGTTYKLLTDSLALGDSLGAMQIYDVLRAIDLLERDPEVALDGRPIRLYGADGGAFVGYLVAALEPRVATVEIEGPLLDPREVVTTRLYPAGPEWQLLVPGMAAHCDLSDLAPLLAGRTVHKI